jgi:hypothetical protein
LLVALKIKSREYCNLAGAISTGCYAVRWALMLGGTVCAKASIVIAFEAKNMFLLDAICYCFVVL